jgi:hypothetical protein
MRLGQVAPGDPFDLYPAFKRRASLAPDRLALAGSERAQEVLEAGIALILPVELLVGAFKQAQLAGKLPFLAREEGEVQRGHAEPIGDLYCRLEQKRFAFGFGFARPHQQALARHRREGDGGLQLRVIAPTGAQISVRPAMIEDIFALRVGLQIAGHAAEQSA